MVMGFSNLVRATRTMWGGDKAAGKVRRNTRALVENLESRLLLSFTAGHLDTTFNPNGDPDGIQGLKGKISQVLANNGHGTILSEVMAAAMQPDSKILVAGVTDVNATPLLDPSGTIQLAEVLYDAPPPPPDGFGPDYMINKYQQQITLVRLNADGSIDTTFGTNGYVNFAAPNTTGPGGVSIPATIRITDNAMVVQSDGKIVVAGALGFADSTGWADSTSDFIVVRFNSDGSLDDGSGSDTTVGDAFTGNNNGVITNGYVTTDYAEGYEVGRAVTIQPDNKILVTGYTQVSRLNPQSFFFTVRYNPDGSLDTQFGEYGHIITDVPGTGSLWQFDDQARVIKLQNDGKILVAGQAKMQLRSDPTGLAQSPWDTSYVVARYNTDGTLDTTFGQLTPILEDPNDPTSDVYANATPGFQWVEATVGWKPAPGIFVYDEGRDFVTGMTVDANNRIYLTGYSYNGNFTTARLTEDGAYDATWGAGGVVNTDVNITLDVATRVVVQADGKVIVTGVSGNYADNMFENFSMVRYTSTGAIDTFFGTNGRVYTDYYAGSGDVGRILLPTPDGKLILVGNTFNSAPPGWWEPKYGGLSTMGFAQEPLGADDIPVNPVPTNILVMRFLNDQISADDVRPLSQLRDAAGTGPQVDVTAGDVGTTTYTFSVVLTDNVGIAIDSLGIIGNDLDVYVTGPNGFSQNATLTALSANTDGQPRRATYTITAPDGDWDVQDTGIYTIWVRENAIWDIANNRLAGGELGRFAVSIVNDTTAPDATATAGTITTTGGTTHDITVTFTDNVGIDITTLDNFDVRVTGPNNFSQLAQFISVDQPVNGTPRTATYRITAPGGAWAANAQGLYRIFIEPNQVGDTRVNPGVLPVPIPNYVPAKQIGSFNFTIPDTTAPTAALNALNITTTGGTTYTFNVIFSDNVAINISTLKTGNVRVTGPNGFSQLATFIGVNVNANGTPRTATYRINAPGGTWDNTDAGTYTFALEANANGVINQVADTSGNYVAATSIGSIQVLPNVADTTAPTVNATAPTLNVTSNNPQTITVTITDNNGLDIASLANTNFVVTGPNGYSQPATFVSVDVGSNGSPRVATFTVPAPAFGWSAVTSGTYNINLQDSQIRDTSGNYTAAGVAGAFTVNVPGTAAPGVFGSNGFVVTQFTTNGVVNPVSVARSAVTQADGKIVAAGYTETPDGDLQIAFARYNTDGTLDATFGTGGMAAYDLGFQAFDFIYNIAIQPDGKILGTGLIAYNNSNQYDLALVRLNTNGTLDNTFGTGGIVLADFANGSEIGFALAVQPDGKILVGGRQQTSDTDPNTFFLLTRFTTTGALDTTFGNSGRLLIDVPGSPAAAGTQDDDGYALRLQSDGKIVMGGGSFDPVGGVVHTLVRVNSNGTLDNTFGTGGIVTTPAAESYVDGMVIQQDGKIVTTTFGNAPSTPPGPNTLNVVRHNADGTLDTTFGTGGVVQITFNAGGSSDWPNLGHNIVVQNDGRIVVSGASTEPDQSAVHFAVARLLPNGQLDSSFGSLGTSVVRFGVNAQAQSVVMLPNGGIVLVGYAGPGVPIENPNNTLPSDAYFALAYIPNPTLGSNDNTLPTAQLSAANVTTAGATQYTFTVTYRDNQAVTFSSIDNNDVLVTGPFNFAQNAQLVSVDVAGNGATRVATYRITPPGGAWTSNYSGVYTVHLKANQVFDTANNFAIAGALGTFNVTIGAPDTTVPTASLTAADILLMGGTTHSFTVTFSDNVGINISTLDGNDILVTGPNSFSQYATLATIFPNSDGTPRTATYTITAPGGTWDVTDFGAYRVFLQTTQVADIAGNFALAAELGTFQVGTPDVTPPTATISATNITPGTANYTFLVTYSDDRAIKADTIDGSDIIVTGPNGYTQFATLVSVDTFADGTPRTATYRVTPPGGAATWTSAHAGTYTISMAGSQVTDTSNNAVGVSTLASVILPDTDLPTAALTSAPSFSSLGGTTYTFTITYADNFGIDAATIGSGDVRVTGPNGFDAAAVLLGVSSNTNGTPRVATYQISAPNGAWSGSAGGTYTVNMVANRVKDISGNAVAAGALGTFVYTPDTTAPSAVLDGPDLAGNISRYTFTVLYTDNLGMNPALTFNSGQDVEVFGPNGYRTYAQFVGKAPTADGKGMRVTYLIPPQGGTWDAADSGAYRVAVRANRVTDQSGNFVPAGTAGFFYYSATPFFNERFYQARHQDVKNAITAGNLSSGYDHFLRFGQAEGRQPTPFFDERFYRGMYPDVLAAIQAGTLSSGWQHFAASGHAEGRQPSAFYDPAYYAAVNPDVVAAVGAGVFSSPFVHFATNGYNEGRAPAAPFASPAYYLANNSDIAAAVNAGAIRSPLQHFFTYGQFEGRNYIQSFSETYYLQNSPDVAAAVANGTFISGLSHFLAYGQKEGRRPSSIYDEAYYLQNNPDVAAAVASGKFRSGWEHYIRFGAAEARKAKA